jgi:hypothetical protein
VRHTDVFLLLGSSIMDLSKPLLGDGSDGSSIATTSSVFLVCIDPRGQVETPEPELRPDVATMEQRFLTHVEYEQRYDNMHFEVPPCLDLFDVDWEHPLGQGSDGQVLAASPKGSREQLALKGTLWGWWECCDHCGARSLTM